MRNLKLAADEAMFAYRVVNAPTSPQRGLSTAEIDTRIDLFEKIENSAERKTLPTGEAFTFKDCEIKLKESEFNKLLEIFASFECWGSVDEGRKGKKLAEKIKETPNEKE